MSRDTARLNLGRVLRPLVDNANSLSSRITIVEQGFLNTVYIYIQFQIQQIGNQLTSNF